jgi:hypothetical protein
MECTGQAERRQVAERGLRAGAGRVLISGPSGAAEITVVMGANEGAIGPEHRVISNASCTTNALAPLARCLDAAFGLETGWMTTIHCYTGSQPIVDAPRGRDLARSRAAALSMVPTTTSAGRLLDAVLPDLAGRLACSAVRVPVASVSAIDLVFRPARAATVAEVNEVLRERGRGDRLDRPAARFDRPAGAARERGHGAARDGGDRRRAGARLRLVRQRMGLFLPDAGHGAASGSGWRHGGDRIGPCVAGHAAVKLRPMRRTPIMAILHRTALLGAVWAALTAPDPEGLAVGLLAVPAASG